MIAPDPSAESCLFVYFVIQGAILLSALGIALYGQIARPSGSAKPAEGRDSVKQEAEQ